MSTTKVIYGGDTVRVSLKNVTHDRIAGEVKDNAEIEFTILRANGDTAASGEMSYHATRGWSGVAELPSITSDETMTVVVVADIQDSDKTFTSNLAVKAPPVVV